MSGMYIKQVLIEGFKTYKKLTEVSPFDHRHNVIVGKNGSGKSNIFAAIQFVLGDKYSTLKAEDRQNLLHEGAGRDVISASVEIIFDNAGGRFPMEKKDVSIKRTIGLKKDEYFVNNVHASKSEVQNLLETAGIAKENPYNIVEQGKVDSLIQMSEPKRLELFKEIAGTITYDERRKESLKVMSETDGRREQIKEVIQHLEKRLEDLEEEKAELQQYQKLDKERRSLEYAIYDKEIKSATAQLEELEKSHESSAEQKKNMHQRAEELQNSISSTETEMKSLKLQSSELKEKLEVLKKEQAEYGKKEAVLVLKLKGFKESMKAEASKRNSASSDLSKLKDQISIAEKDLSEATKAYEKHSEQEEKTKNHLRIQTQRLNALCAKKIRTDQFTSKKSRDDFLKKKIIECEARIKTIKKKIAQTRADVSMINKVSVQMRRNVDTKSKELDKKRVNIKSIVKNIEDLNQERNSVNNQRKKHWKEDASMKKKYNEWKEKFDNSERDMKSSMDHNVFQALRSVDKFAKEQNLQGYYGPLIELFSCQDIYRRCVEITASNKLFQIVVSDDRIAARIINHLRNTKSGRITFMPLNRLRETKISYPESSDAVPMIKQLQFDDRYKLAMAQVFGRTLITRSLEIGTQFARSHGFNTITLEGDQVNKKGAMTGGFIEQKASRIAACLGKREAQDELKKIKAVRDKIEAKINLQNQLEAKLAGDIAKAIAERRHLRNVCDELQSDIKKYQRNSGLEDSKKKNKDVEVKRLENEIKQTEAEIHSHKSEMKSDLSDELNSQDQEELNKLTKETTDLQRELIDIGNRRAEAESKKKRIELDLSTNLKKRAEELQASLNTQSQEEAKEELSTEEEELSKLADVIGDVDQQVKNAENDLDKSLSRYNKLRENLESMRAKEASQESRLASESKNSEKFFTKRNNLQSRQRECRKKIRNVGALSRDDYTKYSSSSLKTLMTKVKKCNEKLKKFSHVNKKALDQFTSFTRQREDLLERKKELDKGGEAIRKLIDHLDMKKDEAIQRTFKGIAKHFSIVFSKLVQGGKASLTMKKKEGVDSKNMRTTDNYAGVGIKVSFSGGTGSNRNIRSLSGGQQSIVALSLIFAIQRCDPSPFYLFDEIDANLDEVYRRSIANMILEQSASAQFLTTTFRPELLEHANKFYGVVYKNRMSTVNVINQNEARETISSIEKV